MRALSAAELLEAWERGLAATLTERMLILLGPSCPDLTGDELADMPLGGRDALLMELRALLFGPACTAVAACPGCGEQLEATVPVARLRIAADPPPPEVLRLHSGGVDVAFRVPSSSDLLALAAAGTAADIRQLLSRCIVEARGADRAAIGSEDLPEVVITAISDGMAAADPQADVELALACQSCGATWSAPFDIATFLWAEIHAWVQQLLRDVHLLARAYGWREPDVLALSPIRRNLYLELIGQ
jgi:hypothetical protein